MVGEANSTEQSMPTERSDEPSTGDENRFRLLVFTAVAILWLGFIAFGQVRARFWIRNEFQIEWKSVTGIWRVAVGELPGGVPIQALVLVSAAILVFGVLGCMYLMLVIPDDAADPVQDIS